MSRYRKNSDYSMLQDTFETLCNNIIPYKRKSQKLLSHFDKITWYNVKINETYNAINHFVYTHQQYISQDTGMSNVPFVFAWTTISILTSYYIDKTVIDLDFDKYTYEKAFKDFIKETTTNTGYIGRMCSLHKEIVSTLKPKDNPFWAKRRFYINEIKYHIEYIKIL